MTTERAELLNRHPQVSDRNVLHYTGARDNPARQINLRAIDPERYTIVNEANNGEVLEEIEESNAFWEVYDGAVYLYQVRSSNVVSRMASSPCIWVSAYRACSLLVLLAADMQGHDWALWGCGGSLGQSADSKCKHRLS